MLSVFMHFGANIMPLKATWSSYFLLLHNQYQYSLGYMLDDCEFWVQFLACAKLFSSLQCPHRRWGNPASFLMGTGGSFHGYKAAQGWPNHSYLFTREVKEECMELYLFLPCLFPWHVVQVQYALVILTVGGGKVWIAVDLDHWRETVWYR